jgi:hypothetical protein
MGVSQMRMMGGLLVGARCVVRCSLLVMMGGMRMVLGCLAMMVSSFFGHVHSFGQEPSEHALGAEGTLLNV